MARGRNQEKGGEEKGSSEEAGMKPYAHERERSVSPIPAISKTGFADALGGHRNQCGVFPRSTAQRASLQKGANEGALMRTSPPNTSGHLPERQHATLAGNPMSLIDERPEATFLPGFLVPDDATALFNALCREITWDESIKARKTACFGQTYDDSGIHYAVVPMHPLLEPVCNKVAAALGFRPSNCLANYYESGRSTMGFHSDAIHNLAEGTGVAIVSLGAERELVFRSKSNPHVNVKYALPHGSLLYMTQLTQLHWMHAVKRTDAEDARISLTFRRIVSLETST